VVLVYPVSLLPLPSRSDSSISFDRRRGRVIETIL
jgi:hypothetical protein